MSDETTFNLADFPAPDNHGPVELEGAPISRRTIKSAVWGGVPARVTSENAQDVTEWDPHCEWYQYGLDLCLNGCQHPGMDIGIVRGTKLFAAEGGSVEFAGPANVFRPHFVMIRADSGSLQIYGHMWSVDAALVKNGRVEGGQYIGNSGEQTKKGTMTPDKSGPHLHFEVRKGGCSINPEPILVAATGNGPVDITTTASFSAGDPVRVFDGPLTLRSAAGTQAGVVDSLDTGTRMIVLSGPDAKGEHSWYEVQVVNRSGRGWVAGTFCEAVDL